MYYPETEDQITKLKA